MLLSTGGREEPIIDHTAQRQSGSGDGVMEYKDCTVEILMVPGAITGWMVIRYSTNKRGLVHALPTLQYQVPTILLLYCKTKLDLTKFIFLDTLHSSVKV